MSKTFQPQLVTAFVSLALLGLSAPMFAAEPPPAYTAGESNHLPNVQKIKNGVVVGTGNDVGFNTEVDVTLTNTSVIGSHNYAPAIWDSVIVGIENKTTPYGSSPYTTDAYILGEKNIGWHVMIGSENMNNYGSVALGHGNSSLGQRSVTVGQGNSSLDTDAVSIGFENYALKTDAIAIGSKANAKEIETISIGHGSNAEVEASVALGAGAMADRERGQTGFISRTSRKPTEDNDEASTKRVMAEHLGKLDQYNRAVAKLNAPNVVKDIEKALYEAQTAEYQAKQAANDAFMALKKIDPLANKNDWDSAYQTYLTAADKAEKISDARMAPYWEKKAEIGKEEYERQKREYDVALTEYSNSIKEYVSTQGAVSVGNAKAGITRQIIGVAAGSENTDAVNLLQLKDAHQTMETTSPAVFVLDDGTLVYQSHVDGRYYKAEDMNAQNEPKSKDVQAVGADKLTKRALTTADHDTRITVGLTNVADGVADTDAVNVRQLKALQSGSNGALQQMDRQVWNNTERLNRFDRKLNRGLAAQAALSGLHKPYNINKVQVTAAMGFYRSSTAIALGAGYRPSNSVAVSAGLATSTKDTSDLSGNVAVSFELF